MQRIAGHLAFFIVVVLWGADVAWASDIACPHAYRPRCDVSAPANASCGESAQSHLRGSKLICEYAMLHESYERIYADQQRRRYAGTLSRGDLDAWRKRRDACTSVRCLDQLFAEWRRTPLGPVVRDAPPRPPVVAESKAARRTLPAAMSAATPAVTSAGQAPTLAAAGVADPDPPHPAFEPVTLSLRDSLQPLPPVSPRVAHKVVNAPTPFAWLAWLSWAVVVLAATSGGFYWLVVRKQAARYLDAAFATASAGMSWLKTLPTLAFVLTGLALLNGVLLVVLLAGWPMHFPGVN